MASIRSYSPIANPHMRSWMGSHARFRARERFGLDLSDDDLDAIGWLIATKASCVVTLRPDGRDAWRRIVAVRWDGRWLPIAYDDATRSVVTFLPPCELEPYRECLGVALARLRRRAGVGA